MDKFKLFLMTITDPEEGGGSHEETPTEEVEAETGKESSEVEESTDSEGDSEEPSEFVKNEFIRLKEIEKKYEELKASHEKESNSKVKYEDELARFIKGYSDSASETRKEAPVERNTVNTSNINNSYSDDYFQQLANMTGSDFRIN